MHGTHTMFTVLIPKQGCCFWVVQSLQFEITTHLMCDSTNFHEQLIENKTVMNADVLLV